MSDPGAIGRCGSKTWRAYLSTQTMGNAPAVNLVTASFWPVAELQGRHCRTER